MSKISKTAAASMRGGPGEKKVDPFDTNEKKIKELRVQRLNKLAINRFDFIDALIVEYDLAVTGLEQARRDIHMLTLDAQGQIQKLSDQLVKATESEKLQAELEPLPGDAAGAILAKAEDETAVQG